jgi:signal transduction histidine kinase
MVKVNRTIRLEWKILWPIIILLLISALTLIWSMGYLLTNEKYIKDDISRVEKIHHLTDNLEALETQISNNIFNYRFDQNRQYLSKLTSDRKKTNDVIGEIKTNINTDKGKTLVDQYLKARNGAEALGDNLINSIDIGNEALIKADYNQWTIKEKTIDDTLTLLSDYNLHTLENSTSLYTQIINQVFAMEIFITLVAILLLVILYNYLKKTITKPIIALSKATTAIADGNFKFSIPVFSNDELGQLADNLREMKERLRQVLLSQEKELAKRKKLELIKDEFISLTSHELKTPITTIKAFNQLLDRYFRKLKDGKAIDYLGKMDKQVDRLMKLVEELLDTSRIQSGKFQLNKETFKIDELVKETVEDMRAIADHHRIIMEGKIGESITGDRYRLSQVLINLLTNAIKYSPQADKVIVKLAKANRSVRVAVQDFGIGIPRNEREKIFERFYRIQNEKTMTSSGLGLGLYISAEIVRRHRGEIRVKSNGRGSTFTFSLPLT